MNYSIVIPAYNQKILTINCLKQLQLTYGPQFEIILVDDGSTEDLSDIQKLFKITYIKLDKNYGFAAAVNTGIDMAKYETVILLNNDIFAAPNWLKELDQQMTTRKLDMAAPRGARIDKQGNYKGEVDKPPFDYLVGWCLAVNRKVFDKIGSLPTEFGRGFFEDTLFCIRAKRAGFNLGIVDLAMKHLGHHTFKQENIDIVKLYQTNKTIFNKLKKEK